MKNKPLTLSKVTSTYLVASFLLLFLGLFSSLKLAGQEPCAGDFVLDFTDSNWNGGTGLIEGTNPATGLPLAATQTITNYAGTGLDVTLEFDGKVRSMPDGGNSFDGPNVYTDNDWLAPYDDALRWNTDNTPGSPQENTVTITFSGPIDLFALYNQKLSRRTITPSINAYEQSRFELYDGPNGTGNRIAIPSGTGAVTTIDPVPTGGSYTTNLPDLDYTSDILTLTANSGTPQGAQITFGGVEIRSIVWTISYVDAAGDITDLWRSSQSIDNICFSAPVSVCSIDADANLANVACGGNGAVTFDLAPTGTLVGATYNVSVSGGNATSISPTSGTYGSTTSFTLNDGAASGGDITVTLTDVDASVCTLDVLVADPGGPALTITALASCADENTDQVPANTYYVEVSAIAGGNGGPYDVTVAGVTLPFDGTGSIFFGPFNHSGVGGAVQVVSVTDNETGANSCETTGTSEVPEILCGINDGGQASGCFCAGPTTDPSVPTSFILAQSAPGSFMAGGSSGQIQKYVLVDDQGFIVAMNLTGLFEVSTPGTYTPYAINYRVDEDPTLMNFLLPGGRIQPILDGIMDNGVLADACFAACNIDNTVTYESCSCYSVGSTLFSDINNDGMFNEGNRENGLAGITIQLLDPADMVVGTDITDSNGDYYFGGLDAGMYSLNIPTPSSVYPISSTPTDVMDNGEDNDDNGIQTTSGMPVTSPTFELGGLTPEPSGAAESGQGGTQDDAADLFGDMTQDFGFIAPVTVGDTTFVDIDMDGTQSIGDLPLINVTVTIFDVATDAEVAFDADGNAYTATQTTDLTTGAYLFENLPPGNYYVEFNISSNPDGVFYDFTTPNASGNDVTDSDAVPAAPTDEVANSSATGPLTSGQEDLTLDAGVVCAVSVTVADPFTICATATIDLTINATVLPAVLGGNWSTADGSGDFLDNTGTPIGVAPYTFGTAVGYVPSAADRARGFVTLTLTSNTPPLTSGCGPVSEEVRIEILQVDCGSFYWDGQ